MRRWLDKLHFNLGGRIFAGFGVVLVIFTAQALVTNLGFKNAVDNFNRFGQLNEEAKAIQQIEHDALDLQRSVLAFSYTGYEGMLPRIHRLQSSLRAQTSNVLTTIQDASRQDRLQRMIDHFDGYARNFETAVEDRRLHDRLLEQKQTVLGAALSRELALIITQARQQRDLDTAVNVSAALEQLLLARLTALSFFNTPDSSLIRAANEHLDRFSAIIEQIQHRAKTAELRLRLNAVIAQTNEYERVFLGVVQATRGYLHMVNVVLAGEAVEIAGLTAELKQLTLHQQSQVVAQMEKHSAVSQQFSRIISLLAIAAGLFSAWGITRNLSRPITAMTRALTELALGHKNVQIPGRGRRDEIGAMAIAADIFKGKADELENASRYKSEFLANMSHELRTPLNSILVLAKILSTNAQGNLSAEQVDSAQIILGSGNDLLNLINDVLDLSKVEAGRMEVVLETRRISDLVADIERQFQPIAAQKSLTFSVTLSDDVPPTACSDWGKIEQIVRNLLSNAFKYTERGGVHVQIARPARDVNYLDAALFGSDVIAIAVSDTGIGIPDNKQEQIFEAFRQVDGTTSRKYGGTGLGLSISRSFSRLIGGELQVASQLNQGSSFTLYVPIDRYTKQTARPADDITASKRHRHPASEQFFRNHTVTVLIVDDDARNRFAIDKVLRNKVAELYTAQDGREALAQLERYPHIDLVLMDMMMPQMDGYTAMRAIRAQPRYHDLPIIALTARAMRGDQEKCLEAGASDYLAKPVDAQLLLDMTAFWLAQSQTASAHKAASDTPPAPSAVSLASTEIAQTNVRLHKAGRAVTVLIADSDMRNTFTLAHALHAHVGSVHMAGDGHKALTLMQQFDDIDILLLGAPLTGMDVLALLAEIQQRLPAQRPSAIIVMLANDDAEVHAQWLKAGADIILVKPIALDALLDSMTAALNKAQVTDTPDD